jgi:hypothetical protein
MESQMTNWRKTIDLSGLTSDDYDDDDDATKAAAYVVPILKQHPDVPPSIIKAFEKMIARDGRIDADWFNRIFASLYDWADESKVWIKTLI